jgi:hypothetical protein
MGLCMGKTLAVTTEQGGLENTYIKHVYKTLRRSTSHGTITAGMKY